MSTQADQIVEALKGRGADAALVVDGNADKIIAEMLEDGWVLKEGVDLIGGKRIRYLERKADMESPQQESLDRLAAGKSQRQPYEGGVCTCSYIKKFHYASAHK